MLVRLRELPAVTAVHALAEGGHRFVGSAGLGLCVGDLEDLAFAALHSGKVVSRFVRLGAQMENLLNARKTPYPTHSD